MQAGEPETLVAEVDLTNNTMKFTASQLCFMESLLHVKKTGGCFLYLAWTGKVKVIIQTSLRLKGK